MGCLLMNNKDKDKDDMFDELDINNPFEVKDKKKLDAIYKALKIANAKTDKDFIKELKNGIHK